MHRSISSRPGTILRWLLPLMWMAIIYWLSSRAVVPHPGRAMGISDYVVDYTAHAVQFAVLMTTICWAADAWGLPERKHLLLAGGLAALYAASDEVHQMFVPGRCATFPDWLADVAGIMAAGLVLSVWVRRRSRSRAPGSRG